MKTISHQVPVNIGKGCARPKLYWKSVGRFLSLVAGLLGVLPGGALAQTLAVGYNETFVIRGSEILGWGAGLGSAPGFIRLPAGVSPIAVAPGDSSVFTLGSDGNVYRLYKGSLPSQIPLPGGLAATALSSNGSNVLAIGANGRAYAFGDNRDGQLGDGSNISNYHTFVEVNLPPGVTALSVSLNNYYSLAVGSDGKVYGWGWNNSGQRCVPQNHAAGYPYASNLPESVELPAGVTPIAVAAGDDHSLILASNGNIYSCGNAFYGSLGDDGRAAISGTLVHLVRPLASGVTAVAISAGWSSSMALGSDGRLYAWGWNGAGQVGDGTTVDRTHPVPVGIPTGAAVASFGIGYRFSAAVTADGEVFGWGWGDEGVIGPDVVTNYPIPAPVSFPSGKTPAKLPASEGWENSEAVDALGRVYSWGAGNSGQLGAGATVSRLLPGEVSLPAGVDVTRLATGNYHSLALSTDGVLYGWGANSNGQLGDGTTVDRSTPIVIAMPNGAQAVELATGAYSSFAIGTDGHLYSWGSEGSGQLGRILGEFITPGLVALPDGVIPTTVAAGYNHTLALASNGVLYAWGSNSWGELGDGSTGSSRSDPLPVVFPSGVQAVKIAAGAFVSFAIGSDGVLYGWGGDPYGQMGRGTGNGQYFVPTPIPLPAGVQVADVSVGFNHVLAVTTIGELYAWGLGGYGQLGDGVSYYTYRPPGKVSFPVGVKVVSASAGAEFSLAIGTDGLLYAWGKNSSGQIGNGSSGTQLLPIRIPMPPPGPVNDQFANRLVLSGSSGSTTGSNVSASSESGEPNHQTGDIGCCVAQESAWWSWTAHANGMLKIDTSASDFATKVAFYTGSAVDALSPQGATSNGSGSAIPVTAGVEYQIAVVGVSGANPATGNIALSWRFGQPQAITMAQPSDLALGLGSQFLSASASSGLWVSFSALTPEVCSVSGSLVTVFAAGSCSIAADQAGDETYLPAERVVRSFGTYPGAVNNQFAQRTALVGLSGQVNGSNVDATREAEEPYHWKQTGGSSVWWRWVAPASGTLTVNTAGSSFDTILAVYSGNSFANLALMASNDDAVGSTSSVTFPVSAGVEYAIAVDGFGTTSVPSGNIVLNWSLATVGVVTNDNFVAARTLTGNSGVDSGSNAGASREAGEPAHWKDSGGKSVWWTWVAPQNGSISFDTIGSGFDTILAVYTGTTVDMLTRLGGNDDADATRSSSRVQIPVTAGSRYFVAVDGYGTTNAESGPIALSWSLSAGSQTQAGSNVSVSPPNPATGTVPASLQFSQIVQPGVTSVTTNPNPPALPAFTASCSPAINLDISTTAVYQGNIVVCVDPAQTSSTCSSNAALWHWSAGSGWTQLPAPTSSPVGQICGVTTSLSPFTVLSRNLTGQTINFPSIADHPLGSQPFEIVASASSGLPVGIQVLTPDICSLSGSSISVLTLGTCIVAANQPGNAQFAPATEVVKSFNVIPAANGGGTGGSNGTPDGDVPLPFWALGILAALLGRRVIATQR